MQGGHIIVHLYQLLVEIWQAVHAIGAGLQIICAIRIFGSNKRRADPGTTQDLPGTIYRKGAAPGIMIDLVSGGDVKTDPDLTDGPVFVVRPEGIAVYAGIV